MTIDQILTVLFVVILLFGGLMAIRGHTDPERVEGWRRYKEEQRKREEKDHD